MDWGAIFSSGLHELISPTTAAYAIAALGLAVHFGYTGLLNFGQAGFMLLGAYGYAVPAIMWNAPVAVSVLCGIGLSVVFALLLGVPTLRLRADYLAIVTIAAAEILRLIVTSTSMQDITGSANGLPSFQGAILALNPFPQGRYGIGPWVFDEREWFYLTIGWTIVAVLAFITWLLMRSPWGRVLKGIREDEDAVRSLGKNVYAYKMQSLIIGGVYGTLAGMIFVLPYAVVPSRFVTSLTFFTWAILLLGGAATIFGPIVGSIIFWVALAFFNTFMANAAESNLLPFMSTVQAAQTSFILVGATIMLLVIFRPQGIFGKKEEMTFVK